MQAAKCLANIKELSSAMCLIAQRKKFEDNISKCIKIAMQEKANGNQAKASRAVNLAGKYHEALKTNHSKISSIISKYSKVIPYTAKTLDHKTQGLINKYVIEYLEIAHSRAESIIRLLYKKYKDDKDWNYCLNGMKLFAKKLNTEFVLANKRPFTLVIKASEELSIQIGFMGNEVYCKNLNTA